MSQRETSGCNAPSCAVSPKNGLTCPGRLSGLRPASRRRTESALDFSPSDAFGVAQGDKPQSFPLLRRADAASRNIGGPHGIACSFQVSANSGEPFKPIAASNLFSKHRWRAALRNEAVPDRPQVALVVCAAALSNPAKRLAWAASGPYGALVGPSCKPERERPSANAGEEVALIKPSKVICSHISNVSLINIAGSNRARSYQVPEPARSKRVVLVVVGCHGLTRRSRGSSAIRRRYPELSVRRHFAIPAASTAAIASAPMLPIRARLGRSL